MAKRISRRTVLRGAGAALALPWLERMTSAAPAASASTLVWTSCEGLAFARAPLPGPKLFPL